MNQQDSTISVMEETAAPSQPGTRSGKLRKALPWATKGGLAIVDQGLISGSNFLLGILLARWLVPEQYGAYALAFCLFLLLSFLYHSMLLEPMAVFSGSAYHKSLRGYLGALVWIHLAITALTVVCLGSAAGIAFLRGEGNGLPGALLGVTIASPCILLFWLARRAYYMELSPARAATGAFIYCVLLVSGLFLIYRRGLLSPLTAYELMATGALVTAAYLFAHLRKVLSSEVPGPTAGEAWHRHWDYGRWALASSVATWIPYYMYYPLLSMWFGMAPAGQLRALMNLALPLEQSFTALSCLFLPYAARMYDQEGARGVSMITRRLTLLFVVGAGVYWAAMVPLKTQVFHLLYGGKYLEVAYLIPLVALETTLWSAAFGPTIVLRAMEAPQLVFQARLAASALSLLVGVPLTFKYGLWGCVVGIVLTNAAAFVMTMYMLRVKIVASDEPAAVDAEVA
jgi:O-antigen/teichoic acid export membrane protein